MMMMNRKWSYPTAGFSTVCMISLTTGLDREVYIGITVHLNECILLAMVNRSIDRVL